MALWCGMSENLEKESADRSWCAKELHQNYEKYIQRANHHKKNSIQLRDNLRILILGWPLIRVRCILNIQKCVEIQIKQKWGAYIL